MNEVNPINGCRQILKVLTCPRVSFFWFTSLWLARYCCDGEEGKASVIRWAKCWGGHLTSTVCWSSCGRNFAANESSRSSGSSAAPGGR